MSPPRGDETMGVYTEVRGLVLAIVRAPAPVTPMPGHRLSMATA
jgi:hypothetical protein